MITARMAASLCRSHPDCAGNEPAASVERRVELHAACAARDKDTESLPPMQTTADQMREGQCRVQMRRLS